MYLMNIESEVIMELALCDSVGELNMITRSLRWESVLVVY